MKIVSAVGILRLVSIVIGLDAIIIGMFAALHCRAFGVYRRAFRDQMHMKTQFDAGYEEPLDEEIAERFYKEENETVSGRYIPGLRGNHASVWEHGKADKNAWAFILTYCITVPLAFVISVTLLGFQVGKTEEEGCKTVVDVVLHAVAALLAIAGGALLICAAVIPDSAHKKDLEWDATHHLRFNKKLWKEYASDADISHSDFDKFFTEAKAITYQKEAVAASVSKEKLIQFYEKWGKDALKQFEDQLQKVYRYDINFEWKLAGGAITIVYGILLIVTTVMIGLPLCKRKKVQPVAPPPPPPPPPVVEEVKSEETQEGEGAAAEAASTDASAAET